MEIEFVEYKATPGEKYLGIATVNFGGVLMLRYRISLGKDGKGVFPNAASYKVVENGQDRYLPAFEIDSSSMHKRICGVVMDGFHSATDKKASVRGSASVTEDFGDVPF